MGRVQYLHLHPMTFYEYLLAMGKDSMAEYALISPAGIDQSIQEMILKELRNYFFVGGMPECIRTFRDAGSMLEVFRVQSEILESYRDDFSKYMPRIDVTCLDAVFLNVAKSVGDQLREYDPRLVITNTFSRKGQNIPRSEFEGLKSEYYRLRGWDVDSGLLKAAKLKELDLADIATDLKARDLLK